MDKKELLASCRFYKAEKESPFLSSGISFWWRIESYAVERGDKKERDSLSPSMVSFLKQHMWEGDGQHDTTEDEFHKRATELYKAGVWSRSYINVRSFTWEDVLKENR